MVVIFCLDQCRCLHPGLPAPTLTPQCVPPTAASRVCKYLSQGTSFLCPEPSMAPTSFRREAQGEPTRPCPLPTTSRPCPHLLPLPFAHSILASLALWLHRKLTRPGLNSGPLHLFPSPRKLFPEAPPPSGLCSDSTSSGSFLWPSSLKQHPFPSTKITLFCFVFYHHLTCHTFMFVVCPHAPRVYICLFVVVSPVPSIVPGIEQTLKKCLLNE